VSHPAGQMMSQPNSVTVTILGKEYQVACPPEQQAELIISAKYLDQQMRNIRNSGKVVGGERIAVMAALNISYELLKASEQGEVSDSAKNEAASESLSHLNSKLDQALHDLRQLQI
jgi:cell division protein ZapA